MSKDEGERMKRGKYIITGWVGKGIKKETQGKI